MSWTEISLRAQNFPQSPIRKLVSLAEQAKKEGITVYHLNIGDPDIETPTVMLKALHNWNRNPIAYAHSKGIPGFLEALKSYYHTLNYRFIGVDHLQVTLGGSEALAFALFATTQGAGDEVLVFEPFYANFAAIAAFSGVKLVAVRTRAENGFRLPERREVEKKISKKTKAILYCNPNNPTGTLYTKSEIEMLIDICKKRGLFLLADEVYREFVYEGKKQVSLLEYMQDIPQNAVVIDSLSKRYSLCGARLGVVVSLNRQLMFATLKLAQARLSAGLIDQIMASELTKVPQKYLQSVNQEYQKRRDLVFKKLKQIPGVIIKKPEGAFYMMVSLPVKNSEDFCQWLLTDFRDKGETVMLAPAAGFYLTPGLGENEVRLAYVISRPKLKRAIELLQIALTRYPLN